VPKITAPVIFTLGADHGVAAEGVSAYPQAVTAQMLENFLSGGAAVSVLARQVGVRVLVADLGVVADVLPRPGLVVRQVGRGAANLARGPAMSRGQAVEAIEIGAGLVGGAAPAAPA